MQVFLSLKKTDYCNIDSPEDTSAVLSNDDQGIGLFCSEFLYLASNYSPSEEGRFQAYKEVTAAMGSKRVVIRTLAKVLGVSSSSGYELMNETDFPVLKVGNRILVPKEKFIQWVKTNTKEVHHDRAGKNFPTSNKIFSLDLSSGELAAYSYLLRCEDRRTHQCRPSYRTIEAAAMQKRASTQSINASAPSLARDSSAQRTSRCLSETDSSTTVRP